MEPACRAEPNPDMARADARSVHAQSAAGWIGPPRGRRRVDRPAARVDRRAARVDRPPEGGSPARGWIARGGAPRAVARGSPAAGRRGVDRGAAGWIGAPRGGRRGAPRGRGSWGPGAPRARPPPAGPTSFAGTRDRSSRCPGPASAASRPWPACRTGCPRGRTCAGRRTGSPSSHRSCSTRPARGSAR